MKKVIVRLGNGLGNQLFTYASAFAFAKKNKAELYIDDESGFYKRHKYELHNFKITSPIIDKKHKFLGHFGSLRIILDIILEDILKAIMSTLKVLFEVSFEGYF